MTTTEIISKAMALPAPDLPLVEFDSPRHCCVTGEVVTSGYDAKTVFDGATGFHADTVTGLFGGVVSDATARVHKNSWNMGSRVFTESGAHYRPLVSVKSAIEQQRPCWRDLARELSERHAGEQVVIILTDDFKKRHWHLCRAGFVGEATPVFVQNADHQVSGVLMVNWPRMIEMLDLLETLYTQGFTLASLATSLLSQSKILPLIEAVKYEQQLSAMRGTPEFIVAHIIAQKRS